MKENYTYIVALLDKSGSMMKVQNDTIGGFNTFVEEQKKVPGEATLTLVQFSDKCETTFSDVPINLVAPLTPANYHPGGWTALNDALARTINDVGAKLAAKPEHERPSKVIVLVMTDGEENKSVEFSGSHGLKKLSSMVTHQKDKYSWEFVFIGANIDAFATADLYGIGRGMTINYTSSSIGQQNAFKSVSKGLAAQRTTAFVGASAPACFFENDANLRAVNDSVLDTSNIADVINKYMGSNTNSLDPSQVTITPGTSTVTVTTENPKSNDKPNA